MYKLVFSDYKAQFKMRIREMYDAGECFFYFYILFIFPWITMIDKFDNTYFVYLSIMVPIALNYLLARMFPNNLSKTLLLCPLKDEEKRQYLQSGFRLRIFISTGVFVIFQTVNVLCKLISGVYLLAIAVFFVSQAITSNIYRVPKNNTRDLFDREYDMPGKYGVWQAVSILLTLFGAVILYVGAIDSLSGLTLVDYGICIFFSLASVCVCIVYVVKFYKPVMELGIMYEEVLLRKPDKAKGTLGR